MYDDIAASHVRDLAALLAGDLVFEASDKYFGWMVARSDQGAVYLRFGRTFPEEDMWALWLGDGQWFDFNDAPARWRIGLTGDTWSACPDPFRDDPLTKAEVTELLVGAERQGG